MSVGMEGCLPEVPSGDLVTGTSTYGCVDWGFHASLGDDSISKGEPLGERTSSLTYASILLSGNPLERDKPAYMPVRMPLGVKGM
jgi:hypothetical protein